MTQRVEVTFNNNLNWTVTFPCCAWSRFCSGAYILWCCKADTVQWTPLYRKTPLSEKQLYILARWPATLKKKNREMNRTWTDRPNTGRAAPSGWLEALVYLLMSIIQYVLLQGRQICLLYTDLCAAYLSDKFSEMFGWVRMHHHWSRTFLFNHILWKNGWV